MTTCKCGNLKTLGFYSGDATRKDGEAASYAPPNQMVFCYNCLKMFFVFWDKHEIKERKADAKAFLHKIQCKYCSAWLKLRSQEVESTEIIITNED